MSESMDANHMAERPMVGLVAAVLGKLRRQERGQGLVEYALILVLVALAAIATMTILGTSLDDAYQTVADAFP